ncbi:MAG: 16S rRNA (uracil(1498)-N(3))-methyltransferase [Pseudomonadales bacterium]
MRINRLFSAQAIGTAIDLPLELSLDDKQSHYVQHVLRHRVGDSVRVFDGNGGEYDAEIVSLQRRTTVVQLLSFDPRNRTSKLQVTLGIAVSRGDRFDFALQKATELGVHRIQPLLSRRTDKKPKPAQLEKKREHWQAVVASACEQCGLNILPLVAPPCSVEQWLEDQVYENGLLLHPEGDSMESEVLRKMANAQPEFTLAIGPEGGFDDSEVNQFIGKRFKPVALGPRILRTETAPLAMLAVLQYAAGDLGTGL